jgi:site-specific DNA recombinase
LAQWLTKRGYRTRQGKPFSPNAVLTVLRNRAYLGEIFFRGTYYQSRHEPLVDADVFERAGAILRERGEDVSLRRSNASDYLLTGLVRCGRCGKRYVGAAAHGRNARYAYYVCFSRHRYGRTTCDADRLPAEALEDAILAQLTAALANQPLVRDAIAQAHADVHAARPKREAERDRGDAQLKQANDALDRYFHAFEKGTMPEAACAKRIDELSRQITGLQARRDELALDDTEPEPLTDADLDALQAEVGEVIRNGDPPARKALLQALIDEIRVESRAAIHPTFALPAVRPPGGLVETVGIEPTSAIALEVASTSVAGALFSSRGRLAGGVARDQPPEDVPGLAEADRAG